MKCYYLTVEHEKFNDKVKFKILNESKIDVNTLEYMAKTAFIDKVLDEVKITKINEYEVDDDVVDVHFK